MNVLAIALFVGLFVFGPQIFVWRGELGTMQMALIASFVLGYFAGLRRPS